jgi:hypothetical protein
MERVNGRSTGFSGDPASPLRRRTAFGMHPCRHGPASGKLRRYDGQLVSYKKPATLKNFTSTAQAKADKFLNLYDPAVSPFSAGSFLPIRRNG